MTHMSTKTLFDRLSLEISNEERKDKMNNQKQKNLRKQMAPFEKPNTRDSIWQLINTVVPFFLLWFLAYQSLSISYVLTFVLCVIAAGFLVRIFIIFHDCCHYSFFKTGLQIKFLEQ